MKTILTVAGLLVAAGAGVAVLSGAFCSECCSASGVASTPAVNFQTVSMPSTHVQAAPIAAAVAGATALVEDSAFSVDPVHSSVVFRVKHNGVAYFYGRFDEVTGSFHLDKDDPSKSTIDIKVATEKVNTNNAGRDKHLRGNDFFSASEFPEITFKGKSFKKSGDSTFDVTGDLTIRGVTKVITVPVEHTGEGKGMRGGTVAGLETKFTINRGDYGVSYMIGPALADEVTLMVGLEGGKK